MKVPNAIRIVLGSDDLPLCKHRCKTMFGFAGAGDRPTCSEHNGQVMGLGRQGGTTTPYMVGQAYFGGVVGLKAVDGKLHA